MERDENATLCRYQLISYFYTKLSQWHLAPLDKLLPAAKLSLIYLGDGARLRLSVERIIYFECEIRQREGSDASG